MRSVVFELTVHASLIISIYFIVADVVLISLVLLLLKEERKPEINTGTEDKWNKEIDKEGKPPKLVKK